MKFTLTITDAGDTKVDVNFNFDPPLDAEIEQDTFAAYLARVVLEALRNEQRALEGTQT
ncbi:MAG: hypothetical protein LBI48_09510 [Burkholderiaceae bacterium]|jgi:hypothetical protein|nr:hypothetical protein [Burkholderiaceae bacterium]